VLRHDVAARRVSITLRCGAETRDAVKAWFHGFVLALGARLGDGNGPLKELKRREGGASGEKVSKEEELEVLRRSLQWVNGVWADVVKALEEAGWDLEEGALETKSGWRAEW
jgi:hypothetical protein